jgi:hypothetical protein
MLDRSRKAARCESGLSKRSLAMEFNEVLLEPNEAAAFLKVSLSWLAKARMRGDVRALRRRSADAEKTWRSHPKSHRAPRLAALTQGQKKTWENNPPPFFSQISSSD